MTLDNNRSPISTGLALGIFGGAVLVTGAIFLARWLGWLP